MDSALDLCWRPLDASQAGDWVRLMAACEAEDRDDIHFGEQDLIEDIADPNCDFPRGSIAAYDGEVMACYAALRCRSAADPVHEMYQDGAVHPAYRGRGLGGQLLDWSERAAVPLHEERYPGRPLVLHSGCNSKNAHALALYAAHGYRQERWFRMMRRSLSDPVGARPMPDGVTIGVYSSQRSEDARLVENEAFRDHWGSTESSLASWAHDNASAAFRPGLSFLAYAGADALGIIRCFEFAAETAATGRRDLYVGSVGTRRAGRNRGIASALLATALQAAAADGCQTASLMVDADSPTGAAGLYERAGFSVENTSVSVVKPVASPHY